MQYYLLPLAGVSIAIVYKAFLRWKFPLRNLPYPPGPPERSFFAGNAADLPATKSWLTYTKLAKKYGMYNVLHFRTYQQHTIVVNSYEANVEFFEKRSNIYSDRPDIPMVNMMGWGFNAGFMRYGAEWRAHRRIYNQVFKPEASLSYRPIQTRKNCDLLHSLLNTPEDFMTHYRT
ncbi:cytochrome P450 [Pholiota conissans]|uniref:Cytochrome P450 n=1 Tax=Pholiota conissans TaxID=109636 RepID=A0A9P5Z688_9AGAR|nr:cytochrome P450 [Pholiota conissans]